ncbi:MAG: hypothetical protein ABIA21_00790 [Candidatus Aenigmatarchaeota archaeon]
MTVNDLRKVRNIDTVGILSADKRVLDIIKNGERICAITNGKLSKKIPGIEIFPISELFNPNSSQAEMIEGGYSLVNKKPFSEILGFNSKVIFTYNLANLSALEKSKFSHALLGRGRDSNGLVGELGGKILGKGCVSIPTKNAEKIEEIMKKWKVEFQKERVMG